jgi:hypothetical protein
MAPPVGGTRDWRFFSELAMPHPSPALALVVIDVVAPRAARVERASGAGPGWLDSSFELQRGLEVREGWSDDERVRSWVDDFLRAQRSVGRTASPSAITAIA